MSAKRSSRGGGGRVLAVCAALLAACTTSVKQTPSSEAPSSTEAKPAVVAPAPIPVLPHDEAVLAAANALFASAKLPTVDQAASYTMVIDPLVDGVTGGQSAATRSMEGRIVALARDKYPQIAIQPFNLATVAKQPLVLVGTFTPINQQGKTEGVREAYRICLVLVNTKTGVVVGKGTARSRVENVDATPTAFFRDSPVWAQDVPTEAYIKTCQASKPGDTVSSAYLEALKSAALISGGIEAYNAGKYRDALALFSQAQANPAGGQLRVSNGIYLANWKMSRRDAVAQSFGNLVDAGLANNQFSVKFLFLPGGIAFYSDPKARTPYDVWLKEIAVRASRQDSCYEIIGHTSRTGQEPVNERLSIQRAETIRGRLVGMAPVLAKRTVASGRGSRENLVGTGKDDASDALDRRVELKAISCGA